VLNIVPRRDKPEPLFKIFGNRVRSLRQAGALSLDEVADRAHDLSKGHLSSIEHGRVNVTLRTMDGIARGLKEQRVEMADLLTRPATNLRDAIYERCRTLTDAQKREVLAFLEERFGPATPVAPKERKKPPRRRVTSTKRKAT
jgi:transcriptional regulator with XRE-family HTH domain